MKEKYIKLKEIPIVMYIPEDAETITLKCKLKGSENKVKKKLTQEDILEARDEYMDLDDDTQYELTDKGRELLERLRTGESLESK